ncbi:hypothetical protein [Williamsia sp. 1135]|uniref:Rv0361 family membrane protein n=1 Tax=Williamsia sp. 1135 TaxID=1889262 RepID=UPI000A10C767|nr:hypothetical protein [Williamsia sp. 1135]ORM25096.1 hypothetical protein BFL43_25460 [Williamsia sp. 1135]
MTQPPQGPYGSGDNQGDPQWGQGPGDGSQQPWGGTPNQPNWGGQPPSEPTWGGQSASEPTWSGQPGGAPDWGNQPQPQYPPTSDYPQQGQTGQYPAGYQQYGNNPPPGGPGGPGGYGPPPGGGKSNKTPWIIGIAAAAVVVIVLAVVLFVVLGGDDSSDTRADPTSSVTTTSSQSSVAQAEEEVETAIRTYTTAFTDRDWDTAISVTCGAEQATVREIQTDNSDTAGMKLNSVTGIEVTGDSAEATVSLTFVNPADQSALETNRYTFEMENRLGDWKICTTRKI